MTIYTNVKTTIEKLIADLKAAGVKTKTPLSKIQDYACEAEFDVEIENRIAYIDASFIFDNPPKDEIVSKIEEVMSVYNSYLNNVSFEKDYTKLEFRSVI